MPLGYIPLLKALSRNFGLGDYFHLENLFREFTFYDSRILMYCQSDSARKGYVSLYLRTFSLHRVERDGRLSTVNTPVDIKYNDDDIFTLNFACANRLPGKYNMFLPIIIGNLEKMTVAKNLKDDIAEFHKYVYEDTDESLYEITEEPVIAVENVTEGLPI